MSACVCVCVYSFPLFKLLYSYSPLPWERVWTCSIYLCAMENMFIKGTTIKPVIACSLNASQPREYNNIDLENLLPPFSSFALRLSTVGLWSWKMPPFGAVMEPYHQTHRGSLWLPAWTESWSGALAGQPYLPQAQLLWSPAAPYRPPKTWQSKRLENKSPKMLSN